MTAVARMDRGARDGVASAFPGAEMVETHISRVFLTSERAYKFKKPVRLPFLDYSTAQRRRFFCREELRLNSRWAPGVYLAVRSVFRSGDGHLELGPEDWPGAIDYCVEMRRLRAESSLAAAVAGGRATADHVRRVAERLARLHAEGAPVPGPGATDLKKRIADSFETLLGASTDARVRRTAQKLERVLTPLVWASSELLDERGRSGRIRDCHGDIRAEHVVLGDEVRIFDCVEFDAGLRHIDVGCDLAFLVMDLVRLGAPGLAEQLVAAYRDAGGDPGEDSLVATFAAYRALVRAKVTADVAGAVALLELGRRFCWWAHRPLILVICGGAATGKSTLAHALEPVSGLRRIASDPTRARLHLESSDRDLYGEAMNVRTYAELARLTVEQLEETGGAIVDATFRRANDRRAFLDALPADTVPPVFVQCHAPEAVVAGRAQARLRDPARESDADSGQALRQLRSFEPLDEVSADRHLLVRADRAVDDTVEAVERGLLT